MNIIIEGPDGTGKSTLVNQLLEAFPQFQANPSVGPTKGYEEVMSRALLHYGMDGYILDRSVFVSEPIYGGARGTTHHQDYDFVRMRENFYKGDNILIYCYHKWGNHEVKDHDSPEHLSLIEEKQKQIDNDYRNWARQRVPFGLWFPANNTLSLVNTIKEKINE